MQPNKLGDKKKKSINKTLSRDMIYRLQHMLHGVILRVRRTINAINANT